MIQKLSKLELQIMETLWVRGESSIREMQAAFERIPAGLYHRADDGLSSEAKKDRADPKGCELSYICGLRLAQQCAETFHP